MAEIDDLIKRLETEQNIRIQRDDPVAVVPLIVSIVLRDTFNELAGRLLALQSAFEEKFGASAEEFRLQQEELAKKNLKFLATKMNESAGKFDAQSKDLVAAIKSATEQMGGFVEIVSKLRISEKRMAWFFFWTALTAILHLTFLAVFTAVLLKGG